MPEKPASSEPASQLSTIRDFLRWALSEFRAAKVVHGHGTTSATDEAAFLILEALNLPPEKRHDAANRHDRRRFRGYPDDYRGLPGGL